MFTQNYILFLDNKNKIILMLVVCGVTFIKQPFNFEASQLKLNSQEIIFSYLIIFETARFIIIIDTRGATMPG